jgi:hypothetical protein
MPRQCAMAVLASGPETHAAGDGCSAFHRNCPRGLCCDVVLAVGRSRSTFRLVHRHDVRCHANARVHNNATHDQLPERPEKQSAGTGTGSAGIIFGCLASPWLCSHLGRKPNANARVHNNATHDQLPERRHSRGLEDNSDGKQSSQVSQCLR